MGIPPKFTRSSFYGFDMRDEDVGMGEYRALAVELKHIFEAIANEADEGHEEIFFAKDLDHALRRFLVDPSGPSLQYLLEVSPTLNSVVSELQSLLKIAVPEGEGH